VRLHQHSDLPAEFQGGDRREPQRIQGDLSGGRNQKGKRPL
jgi:hypothetical protein